MCGAEKVAMSDAYIVIAPIGELKAGWLKPLQGQIQKIYGYPARIMSLLDDVSFALDPEREQYHSTRILEALAEKAPAGAVKVLGITRVDLFIPILTYVFGEAQLGGVSCVVSSFRLNVEEALGNSEMSFQERMIKEAIHELGHCFKLKHCREASCIMHYCRSTEDVDRKSGALCRYCRVLVDDERKRLAAGSDR
jgi:archaemetzincin